MDVVFIKFWEQSAKLPLDTLMARDIQECVQGKSALNSGQNNKHKQQKIITLTYSLLQTTLQNN